MSSSAVPKLEPAILADSRASVILVRTISADKGKKNHTPKHSSRPGPCLADAVYIIIALYLGQLDIRPTVLIELVITIYDEENTPWFKTIYEIIQCVIYVRDSCNDAAHMDDVHLAMIV